MENVQKLLDAVKKPRESVNYWVAVRVIHVLVAIAVLVLVVQLYKNPSAVLQFLDNKAVKVILAVIAVLVLVYHSLLFFAVERPRL